MFKCRGYRTKVKVVEAVRSYIHSWVVCRWLSVFKLRLFMSSHVWQLLTVVLVAKPLPCESVGSVFSCICICTNLNCPNSAVVKLFAQLLFHNLFALLWSKLNMVCCALSFCHYDFLSFSVGCTEGLSSAFLDLSMTVWAL